MNRTALWVKRSHFKVSGEVPVTYFCPINGGLTFSPYLCFVMFGKWHRFLNLGGEDICLYCLMVTVNPLIKVRTGTEHLLVSSRKTHFSISFEFHSLTAWATFLTRTFPLRAAFHFSLTLDPAKNSLPSLWLSNS